MGAAKSPDRRVQRTHRTLTEALLAVILERGWEATTVQRICDRADVGRSTFYAHFDSKEDLLASGFDELRKAIRAQRVVPGPAGALSFAHGIIAHADEHQRLFRAIIGKRSGHVVQGRFRQLLIDLAEESLSRFGRAGPQRGATVHYIAGALFELLIWWLDARNPIPSSELEKIFVRLATPSLAVLREPH